MTESKRLYDVALNQDFTESERGNVLIVHREEPWFNAWIRVEGDIRLEISWRPCNYPALTVQTVKVSDDELFVHMIEQFSDMWRIEKFNLGSHAGDELMKHWETKYAEEE